VATFDEVAAAALAMADTLLPAWLGGHRQGREWVAESRANGGLGDSWSINLYTGRYAHFGGKEKGSDMIALYADLHHIDQTPAKEELEKIVGLNGSSPVKRLPTRAAPKEYPAMPIPDDAPPIRDHPRHGPASAVYRYGEALVKTRYDLPTGKTFAQWTWRNGRWTAKSHPGPVPLYGIEQLRQHKEAAVLIVEGEKCAEIGRAVLKAFVVLTWEGGSSNIKKANWEALTGRDVIIWPDADEPGVKVGTQIAAKLASIASRVRMLDPEGQPPGWDIADAVASGWDATAITAWAREHIRTTIATPEPKLITKAEAAESEDEDYPAGVAPRSALVTWQDIGLATDSKQVPHTTLANASMIIQVAPQFSGKIWWDSFRERIYHSMRGAPQEWGDMDSMQITAYIQQSLNLPKIHLKLIQDAVQHAAFSNARNSLTDWLESLEWDGIDRLSIWISDCLGVELTEYSMAVAKNWLISMIARAYRPGCQMDHMPVLEGTQGRGKSSALEILGGEWYAAVGTAFGSYDFIQTIQGKWLIEIPDMAGFGRREHSHVLAAITTRTDRYRVKYGRFDQDHPRKCLFAATSETDDYLPEMRGYRRYWPLRCTDIDLDALRAQREQLFAQALLAYRAGNKFHEMPELETADEQRSRSFDDPWTEDVLIWCESRALNNEAVYPPTIARDKIGIENARLTRADTLRISNILRANGWIQKTVNNQRQYVRPMRVAKKPN
jgi:putative DNA primase/helicase